MNVFKVIAEDFVVNPCREHCRPDLEDLVGAVFRLQPLRLDAVSLRELSRFLKQPQLMVTVRVGLLVANKNHIRLGISRCAGRSGSSPD